MNYEGLQSIAYLILAIYMIIAMRKKCNTKTIIVSVLTIMVSITIFARVFWIIDKIELIKERGFIESLKYILWVGLANFKIIGVLVGAIVGMLILCKKYKNDRRIIINTTIEALFLAAGYTKVVCTIVGCCVGKTTALPWAVSYPKYEIYNVHPTTLYEVITWWTGFALLHILKRKIQNDSTRISIVVMFYVVIRMFILEGLYAGTQYMGSITARIIYFTIIAICLGIIGINCYKNKKINTNEIKNKNV